MSATTLAPRARSTDKQLCGAQRAKQPAGVTCTRPAGWGTDHAGIGHCKRHGGATRSHAVAAQRVLAERTAQALGLGAREIPTDPVSALLHALYVARFDAALLEHLVDTLRADQSAADGPTEGSGQLAGPTYHLTGQATGEYVPHALWRMHEDAQRRLATISRECVKLNLETRRTQVQEAKAQDLAVFARELCTALGHSPADPSVRSAMRSALERSASV